MSTRPLVLGVLALTLAQPTRSAELTVKGSCSLADAITAANTDAPAGGCAAGDPGLDVVRLTGDVTLVAVAVPGDGIFEQGPIGLPIVVSPIRLLGDGHVLERDPSAPAFRLLQVGGGFYGDGELEIVDLTLRGGYATLPTSPSFDGDDDGGGLFNLGGLVRLERVTLEDNVATDRGGGVYNVAGGRLEIHDSVLGSPGAGNQALLGGALANEFGSLVDPSHTLLNTSRAEGNTAIFGGAVYNGAVMEIVDTSFTGNDAARGGAVSNQTFNSDLVIVNSHFEGNTASSGGALHNFNAADAVVFNATLIGNSVDGAGGGFGNFGGGAIDSGGSGARIELRDSVVQGNLSSFGGGGALVVANGTALVENSLLADNVLTGIGDGGAIDVDSTVGQVLEVVNSDLERNTARSGGAVHTAGAGIRVRASRLVDNFASFEGGAIAAESPFAAPADPSVVVRGTLIAGNEADTGGGIDAQWHNVEIVGSTFALNHASEVGLPGGGGLYFTNSKLRVANSTISGNTATTASGGLHINQNTPATISGTTITGNSSFRRGGFFPSFDVPVDVSNTIIAGNVATSGDGSDDCLDLGGLVVDLGGNLDGDGSCSVATTVDPATLQLGPLADNGGDTPTHALLPGSPAIDLVGGPCPGVDDLDQRGATRDVLCDAGAFEAGRGLPTLAFAEESSIVFEGIDTGGTVDVVLDNTLGTLDGETVTAFVTLQGTAARGFDYAPTSTLPLELTVPAPGTLLVTPVAYDLLDDPFFEGDESIVLTLGIEGPAGIGAIERHVVGILDDEVEGACGELQRAVQDAVGDEDARYRNHGRYVSTVNRTINRLGREGFVTRGCRGCIVSQFARRVPVADQLPCGAPE